MSLPTDQQPPSYVHDLVVEAGRDSVFWATARSPGRRPEPGQTLSTWRNRVVGSSQTAKQSTASEQPIWRGNRLEFGGDDFLDCDYNPAASDTFTIFLAWKRASGSTSMVPFGAGDPADFAPSLETLAVDDGDLRTRLGDANGNGANALTTSGITLDSLVVTAHQVDWANKRTAHWILDGDGDGIDFEENFDSNVSKPPKSAFDTNMLGARINDSNFLEGLMKEVVIASMDSIQDSLVEKTMKTLAIKWRIK